MEWSKDVECMGEWTVEMIGEDDRRIREINGGDGSVEDTRRGGSRMNVGR